MRSPLFRRPHPPTGEALYAGGEFVTIGGVFTSFVARWDGENWSAVGIGITGSIISAYALEVFDDGSGPALYVAGFFSQVGTLSAASIARWDGSSCAKKSAADRRCPENWQIVFLRIPLKVSFFWWKETQRADLRNRHATNKPRLCSL